MPLGYHITEEKSLKSTKEKCLLKEKSLSINSVKKIQVENSSSHFFHAKNHRFPCFFCFRFLVLHIPNMSNKPTEVRAYGSQLLAASKLIGKYCDDVNDEFILCKAEYDNPV